MNSLSRSTVGDDDETLSDLDQTASDGDQSASDRDEAASAVDQEVADRELAAGGDPVEHELNRKVRRRTSAERLIRAAVRNTTAVDRAGVASERDPDGRAARGRTCCERSNASRRAGWRCVSSGRRGSRQGCDPPVVRSRSTQRGRFVSVCRSPFPVTQLTGASLRAAGLAEIEREIERARRTRMPLALAFVDVTDLKTVNGQQGHLAGDELLKQVARALRTRLRPYDVIVRFGGDEFVCALANMHGEDVERRFAGIIETFEANGLAAPISYGIADLQDGDDLKGLLPRADADLIETRRTSRPETLSPEPTVKDRAEVAQDLLGKLVAESRDYAIFMLDVDGNVASRNTGAERCKGYRAEEIIGRHFSVFYPPEDVAAGKPPRELEIAAEDGRLGDEGWRVRNDGSRFWANVVITALRDSDGQLRGFGKVTRDLAERHQYENQLKDMADHDPLSGLLNRRSFERELSSHVARVKRHGPTGAVLMIDLDNFKYHNDTKGHRAGDDLIVPIGTALQARLRETDVLARLGGDSSPFCCQMRSATAPRSLPGNFSRWCEPRLLPHSKANGGGSAQASGSPASATERG